MTFDTNISGDKMRLDKMLSDCQVASRRELKGILKKGEITVNGEVVKNGAVHISPETDTVCYQGKQVIYEKYIYIMMNKPAGYISATEDKYQKTVLDIIPEDYIGYGLFPAGRLDIDTEGMLILTNDGDTAHKMLSPKKHVEKEYFARVEGFLTKEDIEAFKNGLDLGDFTSLPSKLEIVSSGEISEAKITICEGKFHQVKRMFEKVEKNVVYLKRIRMGSLYFDDSLSLGECRKLTNEEIAKLLKNPNL